jgi:drug/metabolite transporter (DMT)-like permease
VADWTSDAVDTIENVVATVRDKTVVPAQKATKVVVFGLLVAFFVLTAVLMLAIALFRVLVVLTGEVWAAYLILGGIFVIAGAFVWTLRASRKTEDTNA